MKGVVKMQKDNKVKVLPRNGLSKHEYIKQHYYQNELLRKLYDSGDFTDDELLYIFSNNKLRRLGFPMKRGGKKYRKRQRRKLFDWRFFNILEETISERLEELTNNKPFDNFVDIKNIKNNNENKFSTEYKYYDAALQGVGDVIRKNSY